MKSLFSVALVVAVLGLFGVIVVSIYEDRPTPEKIEAWTAQRDTMARAWCREMGKSVSGVKCYQLNVGWKCDLMPEVGQPFTLACGSERCVLTSP